MSGGKRRAALVGASGEAGCGGGGGRGGDDTSSKKSRRVDGGASAEAATSKEAPAAVAKKTTIAKTTTTTTTTTLATNDETASASAAPPPATASTMAIPRYLLRIQYDGTNFHGFQRQANARTVQGCVEKALAQFAGVKEPILVTGSSRTDAGVHALDATAHVDLARTSKRHPGRAMPPHPPSTVMRAVNHFLKQSAPDASIAACVRVHPAKFHARFSATGRTYHYRMYVSPEPPSIFERGRVWHVAGATGTGVYTGTHKTGDGDGDGDGDGFGLDINAMEAAARMLVGTHDFSSFRASGCQATSPVRTLTSVSIAATPTWPPFPRVHDGDDFSEVLVAAEEEDDKKEGGGGAASGRKSVHGDGEAEVGGKPCDAVSGDAGEGSGGRAERARRVVRGGVVITFEGPSFLYHQVRLMVATLRAVGAGELAPEAMQTLLDKKNPNAVPAMAPACGLYLAKVHYDGSRKWAPRFPRDAQRELPSGEDGDGDGDEGGGDEQRGGREFRI